jgi:hypothetical protein
MSPWQSGLRSTGRSPFFALMFWAGLVIYAASYYLIAVKDYRFTDHGVPVFREGYNCALMAVVGLPELLALAPPGSNRSGMSPYTDHVLAFLSVVFMFFINPAFIIFVVIQLTTQTKGLLLFLKSLVLCSIPMSWIFFFYEHWQPRGGHVLWVLGMLMVLFAGRPYILEVPNRR